MLLVVFFILRCDTSVTVYLDDLGVCTAAVSCGGVHPCALGGGTLLPQGTLLLLHTPAAFKPGVCLQTHPAAVPHRVTLIEVGCGDGTVRKRTGNNVIGKVCAV